MVSLHNKILLSRRKLNDRVMQETLRTDALLVSMRRQWKDHLLCKCSGMIFSTGNV